MGDRSGDPCDRCEELMQDFLDRTLTDRGVGGGRDASRRLRVLRAAVPLRGDAPTLRQAERRRAHAAGPHGEARGAPRSRRDCLARPRRNPRAGPRAYRRRRARRGRRTGRDGRLGRAGPRRGCRPSRRDRGRGDGLCAPPYDAATIPPARASQRARARPLSGASLGAVRKHHHGSLDVVGQCGQPATKRCPWAELPVGTVDEPIDANRDPCCSSDRARARPRRRRPRRPARCASRSRTAGSRSSCLGEPNRVDSPAARTIAAILPISSR